MAQFPTFGNATGVWNINDVYNNVSGGTWPNFGALGLVGGGFTPGYNSIINSVNIATAGNATVFGDLTLARGEFGAASNFTRCLWAGGVNGVTPTNTSNTIDYVTFSTSGNAADFGDLLAVTQRSTGAGGNATRSVWTEGSGDTDQIVFLNPTIFSNATDFGNLTVARTFVGAMSSPTRVVFAGGFSPLLVNNIDFIETATTGNATDFGDLVAGTRGGGTFSSSTRGVYGGGASPTLTNVIQFITIASAGNATDYGDLTAAIDEPSGTSNSVRGLFFNGRTPVLLNEIQILNIPSGGNTTDFGDTTSQVYSAAANSNSHGGLSDGYQGTRPAVYFNQNDAAVFMGGFQQTPAFVAYDVIDSIKISSAGNATSFGSLAPSSFTNTAAAGTVSNETKGLYAGGDNNSGVTNTIQYITFSTSGNSADFGDATLPRYALAGAANSTRGIMAGGFTTTPVSANTNVIDYVEISSFGNAADFGDLTVARREFGGGGSPTRAVFMGSGNPAANTIDYITIASVGNATDFGDLTSNTGENSVVASSTRAVTVGKDGPSNVMEYITIASTGNAVDFGDLTVARRNVAGGSNSTRGVCAGGVDASTFSNVIDYITIASAGNATDFGDLTQARRGLTGASNGHGGLNGATLTTQTDRAIIALGDANPATNAMDFITVSTTGNATDFGDLNKVGSTFCGFGNSTRGFFAGGDPANNQISLVIISTQGNASDFGDLTESPGNLAQGGSNKVRGLRGGGQPSAFSNIIDFITLASIGNAIDFGDLTLARSNPGGASSPTLTVWGGGMSPNQNNIIDFVTIATTGNASDFGDLSVARGEIGSLSSSTRAVWGGGRTNTPASGTPLNVVDYVTIASAGNATDFGDLLQPIRGNGGIASFSNNVRGGFAGGFLVPLRSNVIQYITIATTGDTLDFGDLTSTSISNSAVSANHGGLQ